MKQNRKKQIYDYYNERAPEYEEIYTLGTGPASIPDLSVYKSEFKEVSELISNNIGKNHIDIACGTAAWLPYYHNNCTRITLIDQSKNMIEESKKKVAKLGIQSKVDLICNNIFSYKFKEKYYDSVLVGLLLSHMESDEEDKLFKGLKHTLKTGGKVILLDSAWNDERARFREKSEFQKRTLNDGREFTILKKYYTSEDIKDIFDRYDIELEVVYPGRVFITGIGTMPK